MHTFIASGSLHSDIYIHMVGAATCWAHGFETMGPFCNITLFFDAFYIQLLKMLLYIGCSHPW